jgi:hypothetical protein
LKNICDDVGSRLLNDVLPRRGRERLRDEREAHRVLERLERRDHRPRERHEHEQRVGDQEDVGEPPRQGRAIADDDGLARRRSPAQPADAAPAGPPARDARVAGSLTGAFVRGLRSVISGLRRVVAALEDPRWISVAVKMIRNRTTPMAAA